MARKPRRVVNQINVVPYIDVMLVLLVIFMITAPMINPGQIDLPSVGSAMKDPSPAIEIVLGKTGNLEMVDHSIGHDREPIERADLVPRVKALQGQHPDSPVVIAADKNVRYEEVLTLMDLLQQAQVRHVGLLAKPMAK